MKLMAKLIWSMTLLAMLGVIFPIAASSSTLSSLTHSGQTQPRNAYDGASVSSYDYDPSSSLLAQEEPGRNSQTAGTSVTFVDFVKFLAAENAAARTFTSSDPLVADLANKIEAAYPGHVVGVNVPVRNAAGQLVTDADIMLKNAVIQVKSGGGKGLTSQVLRTEQATGLPTIGYGPTLKLSVVGGIQKAGGLVTTDESLLIQVVRP